MYRAKESLECLLGWAFLYFKMLSKQYSSHFEPVYCYLQLGSQYGETLVPLHTVIYAVTCSHP